MAQYKNTTFNPLVINSKDGTQFAVAAFGIVELPDGFVKDHPIYKGVLVKADNVAKVEKATKVFPTTNNEPPLSLLNAAKQVDELSKEGEFKIKNVDGSTKGGKK